MIVIAVLIGILLVWFVVEVMVAGYTQNLHDMKRLNKKYGMVTACVGGGQGIAGVIENIN